MTYMPFVKGQARHPASGKKAGHRGRCRWLAIELAERNISLLDEILEQLPLLEPKDQVRALLQLCEYVYPRFKGSDSDEERRNALWEEDEAIDEKKNENTKRLEEIAARMKSGTEAA